MIEKKSKRLIIYGIILIIFSIIGMLSEQYYSLIVVATMLIIVEVQYLSESTVSTGSEKKEVKVKWVI